MKRTLFALLIGATGILTGCSALGELGDAFDAVVTDTARVLSTDKNSTSCEDRTFRQIAEANFMDAAPIEMVVRHGEFTPMIVRMHVGQTYVLRLRNRDQETRAFNAPEFFDAIAIVAAAIDNDLLESRCPGPVILLKPGQSFEMKFIAVTDGRYEYHDVGDSVFDVGGLLDVAPSGGIIRIEERY
jgi:hypothetical protein